MIKAYMTKGGQTFDLDFSDKNVEYFWIDLHKPTQEEFQSVADHYGIKIPEIYRQKDTIINRFFDDNGICFMNLLTNENENIILILKENILITVNNFEKVYWKIDNCQVVTFVEAFTFVIESCIQNISKVLETVEQDALFLAEKIKQHMKDEVLYRMYQTTTQKMMIVKLNDAQDIIANNHSSLINLQLLINFSKKCNFQIPENIGTNIDALLTHADFLSKKTSYLQSTVFSYLNITQYNLQSSYNCFSAVFFLPALIMGFFSMNFVNIPFLKIENSLFFFIFVATLGAYLIYHCLRQMQLA